MREAVGVNDVISDEKDMIDSLKGEQVNKK
jgi:hypothetical protein